MKPVIRFSLLIWLLTAPATAQTVTEGIAAYNRGDYTTALKMLRDPAGKGDDQAELHLGFIYLRGLGVEKNPKEASDWFQKSAGHGNPRGENYLGLMYSKGIGVSRNLNLAVTWFRKAAEQGDARGQNNLGACYAQGDGVPKNEQEAVNWYRKSADQGYALALNNLGIMYQNGRGVAKDYKKALMWYRKAAALGQVFALNNLGFMYQNGRGTPRDLKKAVKWFRKAAEKGDANGQNNLGFMYAAGLGVEKDEQEAVTWYRKAAEKGFAFAQSNLGWMYEKGKGVSKDDKKAVTLYLKAAEQGNQQAQNNLGYIYEFGTKNVSKDYDKAVYWYKKAADQGNASAQFRLGSMYNFGRGLPKNLNLAFDWHLKSALQGNHFAQGSLGSFYEYGINGRSKNVKEALRWYRSSAEQGNVISQISLGRMYENGIGVPEDDEKALMWYRKAAENGNTDAQHKLAKKFEYGEGTPENPQEALKWYKLAAAKGNAKASQSVSRLERKLTVAVARRKKNDIRPVTKPEKGEIPAYKPHSGMTRAEIEAKAKAGDLEAMFDHAYCHNDPICAGYTTRNMPEAIKWFRLAGSKGLSDAYVMLGAIYCFEPKYKNTEEGTIGGRFLLDRAIRKGRVNPEQLTFVNTLKEECNKIVPTNRDPDLTFPSVLGIYTPGIYRQLASTRPIKQPIQKRLALVIGNSSYKVGALENPIRDARLISQTLRKHGFKVDAVEDVDRRDFLKALYRFRDRLGEAGPDATALFYYSGHGVQYDGTNFLIPIDIKDQNFRKRDYETETISANRVLAAMARIENGVKIVLLDACRNNPFKSFTRSGTKGLGLARMDAPTGTIIGYATKAGGVAIDGEGINSPYTQGLVKYINSPGLKVEEVLKKTRVWVSQMTNGKQIPWDESSLMGDFYFQTVKKETVIERERRPFTFEHADQQRRLLPLWRLERSAEESVQESPFLSR